MFQEEKLFTHIREQLIIPVLELIEILENNLFIVLHADNNFLIKSKNIAYIFPLPQFTNYLGTKWGQVVINKYVSVF